MTHKPAIRFARGNCQIFSDSPRSFVLTLFLTMAFLLVDGKLLTACAGESNKEHPTWPSWRGPSRDGHSTDTRVPLEWGNAKNVKWTVDLPGTGNSSPVVWDDRIYLTAATKQGDERWILCINRKSGKIVWQRAAVKGLPPESTHEWNTHASATCATDGLRVYAFFGTPGMCCYDMEGNLLWRKSFGTLASSTGWAAGAASPILFENLVIVNGDQGAIRGQINEKGTDYGSSWLWALNKHTGAVVWQTLRNQGMGWSTPVLWTTKGRQELVLNGQLGVWSYEPRTGKELWHVSGRKDGEGFGELTPIWGHGLLYVFTGKPGPAWAIRPGGAGDISKTHLAWTIQRKDRDVSSPILVGDYIYTISRIGVATCLEAKTGNERWRERLGGQPCASLLSIGNKVMFLTEQGTAFVVEPGPQFRLLHENRLGSGDEFRASPAVVDGQLLIRSDRRLYCITSAPDDSESRSAGPKVRVIEGHRGSVMSVAFSPDGKWLASGSRDRTVKLWNAATGELLRTIEGHSADVHAAVFAADGNLLATASADKTIRLWDVRTGTVQRTFAGHTAIVRSVNFAPDQQTLVSGGADSMIRLWDKSTGKLRRTLTGHAARVMTVVYSPDGKTLASASSDKTALLWDVDSGKVKAALVGHDGGLEAVAFSPNGKLLASSSQDGTVRLWDVGAGKVRHVLKGHVGEIDSVAFSPDGKLVASGCKDKSVKLWNAQTGQLRRTLMGHSGRVESLTFSPDGRTLVTGGGGGDNSIRFWTLAGSND